MYQQDETIPSDEEEELEKLALNFKEKFREIANKYQYLLLQESMVRQESCFIDLTLILIFFPFCSAYIVLQSCV